MNFSPKIVSQQISCVDKMAARLRYSSQCFSGVSRRQILLFLTIVTGLTVCYILVHTWGPDEGQLAIDALAWRGFTLPDQGVYNYTVVTAMVDIGRGGWQQQSRPYHLYLAYMQHLLKMDLNLVLFLDEHSEPFVRLMRRGREHRTKIIRTRLQDFPYFRYRARMAEIMESAEYQRDNELFQKKLCESYIPEYDILQLSKISLIHRTIQENPFNNSFFIWLDGGYGHGNGDIYPSDGVWRLSPRLVEARDHVTFIMRSRIEDISPVIGRLHKMDENPVAGLFFAGGTQALERYHAIHQQVVAEWMEKGVVDDDQTSVMYSYFRAPDLFNMVPGDWNDVFRLFSAQPQGA